jgi:hypothetical protein
LIEGGREDNFGQWNLAVEQLLDDAETVQAGHLNVEKNEVGIVFADEADGFQTVLALRDDIDIGVLEQVGKFVARQLFVVDDDGGEGHRGAAEAEPKSEAEQGNAPFEIRPIK